MYFSTFFLMKYTQITFEYEGLFLREHAMLKFLKKNQSTTDTL